MTGRAGGTTSVRQRPAGARQTARGTVGRRSRRRRVVRAMVVVGILAGLLAGAVGAVVVMLEKMRPVPEAAHRCYAELDGTPWSLGPEQAQNAALFAAMAAERGLPARAVTIAIATALQESQMINIDYGDRDSVGLFQQRPSQGWGSVEEIMDPVYSTGKFYDGLVKVDAYTELEVTVAAQAVQRSGFPDAYAQHETRARAWASALTGQSPEALTCELRDPLPGGDVTRLAARAGRDLPSAEVSTDATRRTVSLAPGDLGGGGGSGAVRVRTALAHWAVAVADEQQVESVSLDGRTWQRESGAWTDTNAVESALRGPDGVVVVTVAR